MNMLVDRFGRKHTYLRISVTDQCNLRCRYCMPADGIVWKKQDELLTYDEIVRVSKILVGLGINKIRLTGGEPLVRPRLEILVEQLAAIEGVDVLAMTTNATLLAPKAKILKQAGISALNISLDTFRPERFFEISRRTGLDEILSGINAALEAGFTPLKLNMVVIGGINDDEIIDFVDFAYDKAINVRFIEYMPFKNNGWQIEKVFTFAEMKERIAKKYHLIPMMTEPSATAKDFSLAGGIGMVSFITSMSDSFCSTCNRLRLTADGFIKSCLFHPAEINLKTALREKAT